MEKVHELICEEHEHNPLVGTAVYETREFLKKLGYSEGGSSTVLHRIERIYDCNLYRRPNDNARKDIGEAIEREFGVTRTYRQSVYIKIANFYRRRLAKGMTKEEAIKACHEHYDPILAKELTDNTQTEQITIPLSGRALYQERLKTCEDFDIEF